MDSAQVIPEKIDLAGIRILKSHFEVGSSNLDLPPIMNQIKTGIKSESAFNLDDKYIKFRIFIKIQGSNKEDNKVAVCGEYHIDFHFIVDNIMDFISFEEDEINFSVDKVLGATIAGISYSTCRGIILDRTVSTDFNGILLPIINPQKLLEEDTFTELD